MLVFFNVFEFWRIFCLSLNLSNLQTIVRGRDLFSLLDWSLFLFFIRWQRSISTSFSKPNFSLINFCTFSSQLFRPRFHFDHLQFHRCGCCFGVNDLLIQLICLSHSLDLTHLLLIPANPS